jgi:hypothetical protein
MGFFLWENMTWCASLTCLVASNQVWGKSMRNRAWISSLNPLIKHSGKKASVMPSVRKDKCSKEAIKYSIVPYFFNLVK